MLNAITCVPVITNKRMYALIHIFSYIMKKYMAMYNDKKMCKGLLGYSKDVIDAKCSIIINVLFWAKGDSLFTWLGDLT